MNEKPREHLHFIKIFAHSLKYLMLSSKNFYVYFREIPKYNIKENSKFKS